MTEPRSVSSVKEADEIVAPAVFLYTLGVVAALSAILAWVFWFRGYA